MSDFLNEVDRGRKGLNRQLPGKFPMWDKKAGSIWKKSLITIGASPKTGKTSFLDERYILYPYLNKPDHVKIKWIYFSYEIDRIEKIANFVSYILHYKYGIRISANTILSRGSKRLPDELLSKVVEIFNNEIKELFGEYDKYGEQISEGFIDFYEERDNPTGIYKTCFAWAADNGKFIYKDIPGGRKKKIGYIEKDPNLWTIIIVDHVGLCKSERGYNKKQNIDKLSEYFVELRNFCRFTIVAVSQFNRGLGKTDRLKFSGELLQPTLEDWKNTGNLAEDSSLVIGLFNPAIYPHLNKHLGYNLNKLQRFYRSAHILANRHGASPANYALFFDPIPKTFYEIPPPSSPQVENFYKLATDLIKS